MRVKCPHCGNDGTILTSSAISDTVSHAYVVCRNVGCGHRWRVDIIASVTTSLSASPNPKVIMPISEKLKQSKLQEQIEHSPTAEA